MKICWDVLQIKSTSDVEAIKIAYRRIIKRYHPDTVKSPEKKREYNIHCAQINNAYEEALKFAANDNTFTAQVEFTQSVSWLYNVYLYALAIFTILFVFLGISFLIYFSTTYLNSLPETNVIKTLSKTIVSLLGSVIFGGLFLAGTIDLILIFLFPRRIIYKFNLEKYEYKLLWTWILLGNILIFYFTSLGDLGASINDPMYRLYNGIWRAACATTLPLCFFSDWLRVIIINKKLTRKGFSIKAVDV